MNLNLKNALKETPFMLVTIEKSDFMLAVLATKVLVWNDTYENYFIVDDINVDSNKVILNELKHIIPLNYFDLDNSNKLTFNINTKYNGINRIVKKHFLANWCYDINVDRVCISHINCTDGHGVVEVIKHHHKEVLVNNGIKNKIEFIMVDYNSFDFDVLLKNVTGKLVYVGDFSFDEAQLNKLEEVTAGIVIVDHHKSAFESSIKNNGLVHLDMTKSGALLAWEFFFGNIEVPYIVDLISDRDLWNYFYGLDTMALYTFLQVKGHDTIGEYLSKDKKISYSKLVLDLEPYVKEVKKTEEKHIKKANGAMPFTITGIKFHGINITSGVSDVLNHVSKIFGTPSFAYWIDENGMLQLSFRNSKDDIHVDTVAKLFGGGGHAQAAGAKVNPSQVYLDKFFIEKELDVMYKVTQNVLEDKSLRGNNFTTSNGCNITVKRLNKSFDDVFKIIRNENNDLVLDLK